MDPWEHATFDTGSFAGELAAPSADVGTSLLLQDERVRIWEIRLAPGARAPFHAHTTEYLWVCVEAGRVRCRFPDGNMIDYDVGVGDAAHSYPTAAEPEIHDLENVGTTDVRFTTVEILP